MSTPRPRGSRAGAMADRPFARAPVVLAAGFFDGVHVGHRRVLRRAVERARAAGGEAWVLTFDRHPLRVLKPEIAPPLLTSLRHRLRWLAASNVDGILVLRFDRRLAALEPGDFVRRLRRRFPTLREVVVGPNWRFGRGGQGTAALLERIGKRMGFRVSVVRGVRRSGGVVSSTRLRRAIQSGDLKTAARLLGRPFSVLGRVTRGRGLARRLGFPTANLAYENEALPPDGVYAVWARIRPGRHGAAVWRGGVLNLGRRPTVAAARTRRPVMEVHLFDVHRPLYGEDIEVFLIRRLRGERRFEHLDALRKAIARDVRQARALVRGSPPPWMRPPKEKLYSRRATGYSPPKTTGEEAKKPRGRSGKKA